MKTSSQNFPRFSLIIPAHNEEAYLPELLDSVDEARACYIGGTDEIEVLVIDNASTDSTPSLARTRGCRVIREDKRVIAAVRNTGAQNARGKVFVFVDADSIIHSDTFNEIDRSLSNGKVVAGASGVRLQRMSLGIAVTYALFVPLVCSIFNRCGLFCRSHRFVYKGKKTSGCGLAFLVYFLIWFILLLYEAA